jgi:hypothetical protein
MVILRQPGLSRDIIGRCSLFETLCVLPSTEQLQVEAPPPIPVHVQRLLSFHALSEAAFALSDLPSPFDYTLARSLGLDRHCLPLRTAFSNLEKIYNLSAARRHSLLGEILEAFKYHCVLVQWSSREQEYLQEQYNIAQLISKLHAPICYLPVELLADIFVLSVEHLGVNQTILQQVCRTWRDIVIRLWGTLHLGTWTETTSTAAVLERSPLSLAVVIDTAVDDARSVDGTKPYAALALAWTRTRTWHSLTINSFPSNTNILTNGATLYPHLPLENLVSLSIGSGCDSSDSVKEVIEAIISAATPKLTVLTFAATSVFQQLSHSNWVHFYSQLTVLEVNVAKAREPVDFLRYCARLEMLKLSGVSLHHLSPEDELPFLQTLRQISLQQSSVQWMAGRIFTQLMSCTLLRPVDPHSITQSTTIGLPVCTSIALQSHAVSILAAFHAPVANKVEIQCNQWNKARANLELSRVWSKRWDHGILRPRILSVKILCDNQILLIALGQMSSLEQLTLELPHPSALGVSFFEALCGMPTTPFTGRTKEEWTRWANDGTEWQPKICPSLVKLQLRYERWLRKGEMDVVSPFFSGVAWSRTKFPSPLQEFHLILGDKGVLTFVGMSPLRRSPQSERAAGPRHKTPLALVLPSVLLASPSPTASMTLLSPTMLTRPPAQHRNEIREHDWLPSTESREALFTSCLTAAISQFIGFAGGDDVLPFEHIGRHCYSAFFGHLRVFHHHPASPPPHSYDILPFFAHLEELDVSNFHFEPCPPTIGLLLCRTLRILRIRNTPLDWMGARVFKRVIECRFVKRNSQLVHKLSRVEMPACTTIAFVGFEYPSVLESFHLPSLVPLLEAEGSPNGSEVMWGVMLPIRLKRPGVLQISM